jgi:hypothetical protein
MHGLCITNTSFAASPILLASTHMVRMCDTCNITGKQVIMITGWHANGRQQENPCRHAHTTRYGNILWPVPSLAFRKPSSRAPASSLPVCTSKLHSAGRDATHWAGGERSTFCYEGKPSTDIAVCRWGQHLPLFARSLLGLSLQSILEHCHKGMVGIQGKVNAASTSLVHRK